MKKIIFLFMFISISSFCFAQSYVDVLYLKDGSIIKGQIIEQIPNESVKIQMYDGSVYIYQTGQIEIIKKEAISYRRSNRERYDEGNHFGYNNRYRLRGYKGFVDLGYSFGDYNRFEMSTTHGYQINNHFFVGGGIGLHSYEDIDGVVVPVFANFRANFINRKITPFGDFKLGYTTGDFEGAYLAIGIGARFALKRKMAMHVSAVYTFQDNEYDYYYYDGWNGYYDSLDMQGFGVKVGFEF